MVESGLAIKLAKGSHNNGGGGQGTDGATDGSAGGLNLSSNGLSIDAGIGIQIDEKGLGVKLTANSGLSVDESKGLKVQSGAGLQVNGDGIGLLPEQTFQKGMIMMFSGSATPAGWALCDGNNGTPDLVDRFIMGGNLSGINGVSSAKFTGDKNNKKFSTSTNNNNSQNITVKVGGTALTVDQMPSHSHETGQRYSTINAVDKYGFVVDKVPFSGYYIVNNSPVIAYGTSRYVYPYTQPIGAGKSHTHSSSATLPAHQHAIDITPPYYILAFIIKL
ncbi:tail fiber protein [Serratia inhibens]|uniref:Tail fiber protein n=2 Tax=Serratia inhibens TaxID=2338073 RepID=A0AA92X8D1_9GAMM|nr:tail fiber protein [Serratia inhibens]